MSKKDKDTRADAQNDVEIAKAFLLVALVGGEVRVNASVRRGTPLSQVRGMIQRLRQHVAQFEEMVENPENICHDVDPREN